MALSVTLNLNQPVSVHDLKLFLSFVPEGIDESQDIRKRYANQESTGYLEISYPAVEEDGTQRVRRKDPGPLHAETLDEAAVPLTLGRKGD